MIANVLLDRDRFNACQYGLLHSKSCSACVIDSLILATKAATDGKALIVIHQGMAKAFGGASFCKDF